LTAAPAHAGAAIRTTRTAPVGALLFARLSADAGRLDASGTATRATVTLPATS
jgi:hypothetical protein